GRGVIAMRSLLLSLLGRTGVPRGRGGPGGHRRGAAARATAVRRFFRRTADPPARRCRRVSRTRQSAHIAAADTPGHRAAVPGSAGTAGRRGGPCRSDPGVPRAGWTAAGLRAIFFSDRELLR